MLPSYQKVHRHYLLFTEKVVERRGISHNGEIKNNVVLLIITAKAQKTID